MGWGGEGKERRSRRKEGENQHLMKSPRQHANHLHIIQRPLPALTDTDLHDQGLVEGESVRGTPCLGLRAMPPTISPQRCLTLTQALWPATITCFLIYVARPPGWHHLPCATMRIVTSGSSPPSPTRPQTEGPHTPATAACTFYGLCGLPAGLRTKPRAAAEDKRRSGPGGM